MTKALSVNPENLTEATLLSYILELEQVMWSVFDDYNQRTTEAGRFNIIKTSVF